MEQPQSYEGFSNEKTWYIALRIDNDPKAFQMMKENRPFTKTSVEKFVRWIHLHAIFDSTQNKRLFPDITRYIRLKDQRWKDFGGANWKELAEHFNTGEL